MNEARLKKCEINPNRKICSLYIRLSNAAEVGDISTIIKLLRSFKESRLILPAYKNACLLIAVSENQFDVVKRLLEIRNVKQRVKLDSTVFEQAVLGGRIEILNLLLTVVGTIKHNEAKRSMLLLSAVRNERVEIVKRLLKVKAIGLTAHAFGNLALGVAVERNYKQIVEILLKALKKTNESSLNIEQFKLAYKKGRLNEIKTLFHVAQDQSIESTLIGKALYKSVKINDPKTLAKLLDGSVISPDNEFYIRAIYAASQNGHFAAIKALLKYNILEYVQLKAIKYAAKNAHWRIVDKLLDAKIASSH